MGRGSPRPISFFADPAENTAAAMLTAREEPNCWIGLLIVRKFPLTSMEDFVH